MVLWLAFKGGRGFGGVGQEAWYNSAKCSCSPEQPYPGLYYKECGQQVKGGHCPIYATLMRPPPEVLGPPH